VLRLQVLRLQVLRLHVLRMLRLGMLVTLQMSEQFVALSKQPLVHVSMLSADANDARSCRQTSCSSSEALPREEESASTSRGASLTCSP